MSERNMTGIEVDGFKYEVSTAARDHVFEVLERYESTKREVLRIQPVGYEQQPVERTIVSPTPEKTPIFRKKDKKKK